MTSTYPGERFDEFDGVDPALWTRLRRWTPAEALSGPGRSAQRWAMIQAGDDASVRAFLAGLPNVMSQVIAVNNMFGPNIEPDDIVEFLLRTIGCRVHLAIVKGILNSPDDDLDDDGGHGGPGGSGPSGVQVSAAERASEALTTAKTASMEVYGSETPTYNYRNPLLALRDAQVASGQAVLAVAEELSASRAEVGQVAAAVRELTATLSSVLGEVAERVTAAERTVDEQAETIGTALGDITYDLRALRPDGSIDDAVDELRDIASALCVLADQADRPRWWQWRRRIAHARAERAAQADQDHEAVPAAESVGVESPASIECAPVIDPTPANGAGGGR